VEFGGNNTGNRSLSGPNRKSQDQTLLMTALEGAIANAESKLNFSRRRLLREILENSQDAYFLSSRDLAKRYKVDTATVVRTIQALGYKRYANFLADLRSHFVSRITPYSVMKTATRERRGLADRVTHSLETESRNLDAMRASLRPNQVIDLAKCILRARRIMIVGVDFAASLSRLLAYGLVSLGHDATAPEGSTGNLQQSVGLLGPKDLFIAISFGRCLKATVDSVLYAHARKVPTFGITDNEASPIARCSDSFWITSIAHPSFHGSYVAPLAAMNALLVACAHIHPQRSLQVLRRKEQEFGSGTRWYSPENDEGSRNQSKGNSHG
jgi:DNA-binding MurR/RpiR family transcriptional regulator